MNGARTKLAAALLAALVALAPVARSAIADVASRNADNVQEGDNSNDTDQGGEASSGDAVSGQVVGVVSSGNASVDGTSSTENSDASSGDAYAGNDSHSFTGLSTKVGCGATSDCFGADVFSTAANNVQQGDNDTSLVQFSTVTTGDAIAGSVAGIVSGGNASARLGNGTADSDVSTGDAEMENAFFAFTGLSVSGSACCPLPDVLADVKTGIDV